MILVLSLSHHAKNNAYLITHVHRSDIYIVVCSYTGLIDIGIFIEWKYFL